jgi:hypothetical protein
MRWVCVVFLVAWVGVSYKYLIAEWFSMAAAPSLWGVDVVEKKRRIDGPLYEFLLKTSDIVPASQTEVVYLYAVDNGYTYYKANYYLYPRSVRLIDPATIRSEDFPDGSYFIFYILPTTLMTDPDGVQRGFDELIAKLPPAVRLYRTPNAGVYRTVSVHG